MQLVTKDMRDAQRRQDVLAACHRWYQARQAYLSTETEGANRGRGDLRRLREEYNAACDNLVVCIDKWEDL